MIADRRLFLGRMLAGVSSLAIHSNLRAAEAAVRLPEGRFGVLLYSYGIRARQEPKFREPDQFATFARGQGFGGVQMPISVRPSADCHVLRDHFERINSYVEGIVNPPHDPADADRFDAELRTAKECGASVLRMVMLGGRRYETFRSMAEYREFKQRSWESLQRAASIVARHQLRLAVENHKDYRVDELVEVLQRLSSEFVGVCLDTGNNIALLEDPWQVIDKLAPWTLTVHLKDMAVEVADDGFLLAEVPLGSGFLDLSRIIDRVSSANPRACFNLEMITRDPLRIPCLRDAYWATFEGVPGVDLARTMRLVHQHASPQNGLIRTSRLTDNERIAKEQEHVEASMNMMKSRFLVTG
jgi:sugar phosphate isomerase/epimerase